MSQQLTKNEVPISTIKRLSVEGFKSISQFQSIEVRPLTILAGANSSGKSSILQPLLLLKQTLEATYDPGPLLINGPNLKFTSADQFLSKSTRSRSGTTGRLVIEIEPSIGPTWRIEFARKESGGIRIKDWQLTESSYARQYQSRFTPQMESSDILRTLPEDALGIWKDLVRHFENPEYVIQTDRCFFNVSINQSEDRSSRLSFPVFTPSTLISHLVRSTIHLPGLRGNPERTYPVSAIGETFDGTFDSYTASVITHWERYNATSKIGDLREGLEHLGLTRKVETKSLDETQVELRVGRLPHATQGGAHDLVNVADVGFGVSQTLPILVALIQAEPGQLVYIEQPEIHLHPRAQVALARILGRAARKGVRVLIETHSSLLLLAIQSLVAEGSISGEDVALHWFCRDEEGATNVISSFLDQSGTFGEWPEDFGEVSLELENRYLDASEKHLPGFGNG
jgi:predicted ATPase